MKYLISSLIVIALSCKSTTNALRPENVFKDAKGNGTAVDPPAMEVESIVSYLASDELAGREAGTEGIELAAAYIEDIFKKNNIESYFSTYRDTLSNFSPTTYNIVGYIEGNDPELKDEFVIVGAHYDHIGAGDEVNGDVIANGANDNAAGTAAVIELAKYFAYSESNKRSLLFVLFSAEESGLLGSAHLAKKLKESDLDLYTMVNFEMIGVPMTKEYTAYLTGFEESNMASKMNEYAGKNLIGFLPQAKEYNLFKRSDNYPFYQEFGIPAQTICTFDFTNYEYYHHVDDEVSRMDFEHMTSVINEMKPVLEKITNSTTREIKMNE